MAYLRKVRLMLAEQIAEIKKSREEYQMNRSLIVNKYQLFLKFQECTELTGKMVSDIAERIYVDAYGVKVRFIGIFKGKV